MNAPSWIVALSAGVAAFASACAAIVGIQDMTGQDGGGARGDASAEGGTDAANERQEGSLDAGGEDGDAGGCTTPHLVQCDGSWTDPTSDPKNCGWCGNACTARQQCIVGYRLEPRYVDGQNGSDTNDGTTPAAAWKTFAYALQSIDVGSAIVVMPYEHYPPLQVSCPPAPSGTPSQPIVVTAFDERTARFESDGTSSAISLQGCSNWVLDGLTATTKDAALDSGASVHTVQVGASTGIQLRRLLVSGNNRSAGANALDISDSASIRVSDTEVYRFSRNGVSAQGRDLELERVYLNPLATSDPDGSTANQTGIVVAGWGSGGYARLENVVVEGATQGIVSWYASNLDVSILGSIVLGAGDVAVLGDSSLVIRDLLVANTGAGPLLIRSNVNATVSNVTLLQSGGMDLASYGDAGAGIVADSVSAHGSGVGINVSGAWRVEDTNSSLNPGGDFRPPLDSGIYQGCWQQPPTGLGFSPGSCVAYVSAASSLADAGPDGGSVGANIVYRYDDGGPTTTPLWACGRFPCGPVVPSINDPADASVCTNLTSRLNFVEGGCPFP